MSKQTLSGIYGDLNDNGIVYHTPGLKYSHIRKHPLKLAVVSHSGGNSLSHALEVLDKNGTSVNIIIDRNGDAKLHHLATLVTYMCGNGIWDNHGKGADGIGLNETSFNIMLIGNGCNEEFTKKQLDTLLEVAKDLKDKYGITDIQGLGDVYTHPFMKDGAVRGGDHVAPGPLFNYWETLAKNGFGKFVALDKEISQDGILFKRQETGLSNIQKALGSLGYDIKVTDIYDNQTDEVVRSFVNHYLSGNGNENHGTRNTKFTVLAGVILDKLTNNEFSPLSEKEDLNKELYENIYQDTTLIDGSISLAGDAITTNEAILENVA